MDKLTFISEIIKSLAWPLVAITGICVFRNEIKRLISKIKKGKIGTSEFEFEKELEVLSEKTFKTENPPKITEREKALAASDPNGAIIKTWLEIEHSARKVFYKFDIPYTGTPHTPFLSCIKKLEEKGIISFEESMLIRELQIIRNRGIHELSFRPSSESAEIYIELAKNLIIKLENSLSTNN
ncbi:MAG: hypothetical protein DM484_25895 [Candidatus Methylumidiphilus alinenensis]|uniref:DUF4145 domain-containing protein n=1 Tax=Candidatus Methylumidiphilus alinenensis TaxID=2202197 RepID=A0A2W4SDD4_9GAMM|nr:MAG: hypothetical protein DM484_25895 [Candidatus Methylumidiphilus alinenensis]